MQQSIVAEKQEQQKIKNIPLPNQPGKFISLAHNPHIQADMAKPLTTAWMQSTATGS